MISVASRMADLRRPSALRLMGGEMTGAEVQKVHAAFDAVEAAVAAGQGHQAAMTDLLHGGRLKKAIGTLTAQEDRTVRAVLNALVRTTEKSS